MTIGTIPSGAQMHDDRALVEARLARALRERIRPAVYARSVPLTVAAWHAPGEPVPFAEAAGQEYAPTAAGEPWGPPWGTTWFRLTGTVPAEWAGETVEAVVDLGFDADRPGFQCEGLAYTPDGAPVKGLNPRNAWLPVAARPGEPYEVLVEAAANPLIDYRGYVTPWATRAPPAPPPCTGWPAPTWPSSSARCGSWPATWRCSTTSCAAWARTSRAASRSCARWSGPWTRWTSRTSPAPRPAPANGSPASWPAPPTPARTGSPPSATRTSTPPGCGRCARPCARWPGPPPT
ncbi:hypothetical protein [Thermocatellispora tengchongensis]|uniref:hypothetical protein n=1 Tax=Thermocatellispora tengchongensis TaxID=1073253 RepID=UPI0036251AEB